MRASSILLLAITGAGCGHAGTSTASPPGNAVDAAASPPATVQPSATDALCRPSAFGFLKARLQGAIDAELDWSSPATPQCLGGPRPGDGGLRLLYKGTASGSTEPLLIVVGITLPLQAGTARNVPANVTVVREGTGVFYATQGNDKCALDEVTLEPTDGPAGQYRLAGRGYCIQPARAVGTDAGAVLMSRFDVAALVDVPREP